MEAGRSLPWRMLLLSILFLVNLHTILASHGENIQPPENVQYPEDDEVMERFTFLPPDHGNDTSTDNTEFSSIVTEPDTTPTSNTWTSTTTTTTPLYSNTTLPPPTSEKEMYQRTKDTFSKIDTDLTEYSNSLKPQPANDKLQPLAFSFQFGPEKRIRREDAVDKLDTKAREDETNVGEICISDAGKECEDLQIVLTDIEIMANIFSDNPQLWTIIQLTELEKDSTVLEKILSEDVLKDQIYQEKFIRYVDDTMHELLTTAVKEANDEIEKINQRETDSIIFVAVFGSIGGVLVVSLLAGIGFVAYKGSTSNKKKKNKTGKMPGNTIPVEPPYSEYESIRPPAVRGPAPQPPPSRSSTDLYSRPHAPKSERYYTADEVNGRYGPGGNQQRGLRRVY